MKIDKKNERKKEIYGEKKRSGLEMRSDVYVIPDLEFALVPKILCFHSLGKD